jgi:2-hydroxychromene-2-carboxylate isomerase
VGAAAPGTRRRGGERRLSAHDPDPAAPLLYFDLGSPYAYLALERLHRFDFGGVTLRPIALGALFKITGRSSWGLSERRELGMAEVQARARAYELPPLSWPLGWPSNYLNANRACLVADELGALESFAKAALRAAFIDGADLSDADAISGVARAVGLDVAAVRERIAAPEIKERLRERTEEAYAAGVIGVPTLIVDGRVFWGDDQLEIAAAHAHGGT